MRLHPFCLLGVLHPFRRTAWSEANYPWGHEFEQWDSCHLALRNGSASRTDCAALTYTSGLAIRLWYRDFPTEHTHAWHLIKIGRVDT